MIHAQLTLINVVMVKFRRLIYDFPLRKKVPPIWCVSFAAEEKAETAGEPVNR
jgi:hypothetical protein